MAATEFGSGSAQTVQRWSNRLAREALDQTYFKRFADTSGNSPIQIHTDLNASPGDIVRFDVLYQDRGDGVQGDTTLEGYEAALEFYQDSVYVDQLRHAHNFRRMTQQRTVHDLRKLAKDSLAKWFGWKIDTLIFAYLAGVAGDDTESASGTLGSGGFAGNPLQNADANHHLNKTGNNMALAYIDTCVAWAKTVNPRIRPIMVDGKRRYVMVLHPYSVHQLRIEAGDTKWTMIQARANGNGSNNPIFTGALGEYNGVVLHESEFIPRAATTAGWSGAAANDTANIFMGAQAASFAMGNAYSKVDQGSMNGGSYFRWDEQVKDYNNNKGVAAGACFGITKNRFNGTDFGTIRVTTTDAKPS